MKHVIITYIQNVCIMSGLTRNLTINGSIYTKYIFAHTAFLLGTAEKKNTFLITYILETLYCKRSIQEYNARCQIF